MVCPAFGFDWFIETERRRPIGQQPRMKSDHGPADKPFVNSLLCSFGSGYTRFCLFVTPRGRPERLSFALWGKCQFSAGPTDPWYSFALCPISPPGIAPLRPDRFSAVRSPRPARGVLGFKIRKIPSSGVKIEDTEGASNGRVFFEEGGSSISRLRRTKNCASSIFGAKSGSKVVIGSLNIHFNL